MATTTRSPRRPAAALALAVAFALVATACTSGGGDEADAPSGRQQVDALYRLLAQVDDYWKGRFGRNGIDGDGQGFVATVRYCLPGWCPMQNAFWEWGPQQATFGDRGAAAANCLARRQAGGAHCALVEERWGLSGITGT